MPIIELQRRLREAGRIRLGDKAPKGNPRKLDAFRFTSSDEAAIEAIAELYGGEAKPWGGAPVGPQWEVFTKATVVNVLVPPADLAYSQWLESWSGGGCQRRCDGVHEYINDGPCLCDPGERACKPTTRLGVILPELPGIGIWRCESHGWNAAAEMDGTLHVVQIAQAQGRMVAARLLLEQREKRVPGKPVMRFGVPVLDLDLSVAALTTGAAPPAALPAAEANGNGTGLTPIQEAEAMLRPSFAEEIKGVGQEERPRRSGGAEPIRRTGLSPRRRDATAPDEDEEPAEADALVTSEQVDELAKLLALAGIAKAADKHAYVAEVVGHEYGKVPDLTAAEAEQVLEELRVLAESSEKGGSAKDVESDHGSGMSAEPETVLAGSSGESQAVSGEADATRHRYLFALLGEAGITTKPKRLSFAKEIIDRQIDSYSNLTDAEEAALVRTLEERLGKTAPLRDEPVAS